MKEPLNEADMWALFWAAFIALCFAAPLIAIVIGGFSGPWGI